MFAYHVKGRRGLNNSYQWRGTNFNLCDEPYYTTLVYHTFPGHPPLTCLHPEAPSPFSFISLRWHINPNSNHPFGLLIIGGSHVYKSNTYVKNFCLFSLVNLSLASLICRVSPRKPKTGEKDFFLPYSRH